MARLTINVNKHVPRVSKKEESPLKFSFVRFTIEDIVQLSQDPQNVATHIYIYI